MARGPAHRWATLLVGLALVVLQLGEVVHLHGHLETDLVDHESALPAGVAPCAPGSHVESLALDHHRACPACVASYSKATPPTPGASPDAVPPNRDRRLIPGPGVLRTRPRRAGRGRAPPID